MLRGISRLAASELGGVVRRNVAIYAIYGLALAMVLIALGFLLAALHTVLAERFGSPITASLVIAAALAVTALLLVLIAALLRRRSRRKTALAATALMVAPAVAAPVAVRLLSSRASLATAAVATVLAVGALLGRQFSRHDSSS